MSAKVCFVTAVLAVTAFTLSSSCPTKPKTCSSVIPPDQIVCNSNGIDVYDFLKSCGSDQIIIQFLRIKGYIKLLELYQACIDSQGSELLIYIFRISLYNLYWGQPELLESDCSDFLNLSDFLTPDSIIPTVYGPNGEDIFDLYSRIPLSQCNDLFTTWGLSNLIPLFEAYNNGGIQAKLAYIQGLYDYYGQNANAIIEHCQDLTDLLNSISDDSSSSPRNCGISPDLIVYTPPPNCMDIFDVLKNCNSPLLVIIFLKIKGYKVLLDLYLQWNKDQDNLSLEYKLRMCLYNLYRYRPDLLPQDYTDFQNLCGYLTPDSIIPTVYGPNGEDILDLYCSIPLNQCTDLFKKWGMSNLIPMFEKYNNGGIQDKLAYIQGLYGYYGQNANAVIQHCQDLTDLLNSISDDSSSSPRNCGISPDSIVFTPNCVDLFDYYNTYDSFVPVAAFFKYREYIELLELYIQWKTNSGNKYFEFLYRICLYNLYRGNRPLVRRDCQEFPSFYDSWQPSSDYDIVPVVYGPNGEDILSLYDNISLNQCSDLFTTWGLSNLIPLLKKYKSDSDQMSKIAFTIALYNYYNQYPQKMSQNYQDLMDYINGSSCDDDSIQIKKTYTKTITSNSISSCGPNIPKIPMGPGPVIINPKPSGC